MFSSFKSVNNQHSLFAIVMPANHVYQFWLDLRTTLTGQTICAPANRDTASHDTPGKAKREHVVQ
jgi:hypothetical protein